MTDPRDYDLSGLAAYPKPQGTPEPEPVQRPATGPVADYEWQLTGLQDRERELQAVSVRQLQHGETLRQRERQVQVTEAASAWREQEVGRRERGVRDAIRTGVAVILAALAGLVAMGWIVWGR